MACKFNELFFYFLTQRPYKLEVSRAPSRGFLKKLQLPKQAGRKFIINAPFNNDEVKDTT
jgi:hypothetical protein